MRARGPLAAVGSLVLSLAVLLAAHGCDDDPCAGPTRCVPSGTFPLPTLTEYDFFQGKLSEQNPKDGVVPYTVAAPLWADQAGKGRFIVLPEGGKIGFSADGDWEFPDGTILVKSFYFDHDRRDPEAGARILETRLLVRGAGAWKGYTYVWNDAQTEATVLRTGKHLMVDFIDVDGGAKTEEYIVPNLDQCSSCHERDDEDHSLGLITPQMNLMVERDGKMVPQIAWLAEQGMFKATPPDAGSMLAFADPFGTEDTLEWRARSYLHGNCAHCHQPGGGAGKSGLVFLATETDPAKYGVCKLPAAAGPGTGGRPHDIVPGDPDNSIILFRMNSLDPEIKMPELPNRVIDARGVQLITDWISAMPTDSVCIEP